MSIVNLMTDSAKPDQNLQVASISQSSDIEPTDYAFNQAYAAFGIYSIDHLVTQTIDVITPCGYVNVTNTPNILSQASQVITVNYSPIAANATCIIVNGVNGADIQNNKLDTEINSIASDSFSVRFTNLSATTATISTYAFIYLIVQPGG